MKNTNITNGGKKIPPIFSPPSGAYTSQDASRTNVQPDGGDFICLNCGISFVSKKYKPVYCSSKCKSLFWDKNHRDYRRRYAMQYRKRHIDITKLGKRGKYIRTPFFRERISFLYKTTLELYNPNPRKYFTIEEIKKAKREKDLRWKKRHPDKVKLMRQANKVMRSKIGKLSVQTIQMVYEDNIKKYGTLTCYLCERPIEFGQDHLEHKIPLSRNGTNNKENLDIACQKCNLSKGSKTEKEYKELFFHLRAFYFKE